MTFVNNFFTKTIKIFINFQNFCEKYHKKSRKSPCGAHDPVSSLHTLKHQGKKGRPRPILRAGDLGKALVQSAVIKASLVV